MVQVLMFGFPNIGWILIACYNSIAFPHCDSRDVLCGIYARMSASVPDSPRS